MSIKSEDFDYVFHNYNYIIDNFNYRKKNRTIREEDLYKQALLMEKLIYDSQHEDD